MDFLTQKRDMSSYIKCFSSENYFLSHWSHDMSSFSLYCVTVSHGMTEAYLPEHC